MLKWFQDDSRMIPGCFPDYCRMIRHLLGIGGSWLPWRPRAVWRAEAQVILFFYISALCSAHSLPSARPSVLLLFCFFSRRLNVAQAKCCQWDFLSVTRSFFCPLDCFVFLFLFFPLVFLYFHDLRRICFGQIIFFSFFFCNVWMVHWSHWMSVAFGQTAGQFHDSLFGQDKCASQCNKPNLAARSFSDFPAGPRASCLIILLSAPAHSSPLSLSCPRHFGQSEWQPTLALITLNWPRRANSSPKSHVLISLSLFYPACLLTDPTGSVGVKQILTPCVQKIHSLLWLHSLEVTANEDITGNEKYKTAFLGAKRKN